MATTMTWGAGGTYTGLVSAYAAITWNDDIVLEQVGTATDTSRVDLTSDQNGYSLIIKGNGDLYTNSYSTGSNITGLATFYASSASLTGDITIEDLNTDCGGFIHKLMTLSYTTTTGVYNVVVRRCFLKNNTNQTYAESNQIYIGGAGINEIHFYCNDLDFLNLGVTGGVNYSYIYLDGTISYAEDNILRATNTTSGTKFGIRPSGTACHIKRNYFRNLPSNAVFYSLPTSGQDDTYSDNVDSNLSPYNHDQIAFSTDSFLSVSIGNPNYGIPKAGSPVYDDATQTSNIPDNLVGLNGVAVTYRAAGPYTPSPVINPPAITGYSKEPSGNKVSWTPYSPAQEGFENVEVFWETIEPESAFQVSKATVAKGTNFFVIPYDQIVGSLNYVRVRHTEE